MHGRIGPGRPRTSRAPTISARQRRIELAAILARGIARAIAARAESREESADPAVDGLALSADLRLSVPLAGPFTQNGPGVGEHA